MKVARSSARALEQEARAAAEELARRLVHARKAKGLSQAELAKILGVSTGTVGGWETGEHGIRQGRLRKVSKALGVPVADLVA